VSALPPPAICANCGGVIPPRARACPACGADERTGWREVSVYDGLDLPDSAYEDDAVPSARRRRRPSARWYWVVTACILAAGLILGAIALW